MAVSRFKNCRAGLFALLWLAPLSAMAGGIALNSTRIIYPQDARQSTFNVRNTSTDATFLVQSWVDNPNGGKSSDFIVTPPLYTSAPKDENVLRLMYSGKALPTDRESLYYFNVKGIPSIDKQQLEGKNALILAAVTRIKLFVRPAGLKPSPDAAPAELRFRRDGKKLKISNPTPYFLTVVDIKTGSHTLEGTMVPPKSEITLDLPAGSGKNISFNTINDYGATAATREVPLR